MTQLTKYNEQTPRMDEVPLRREWIRTGMSMPSVGHFFLYVALISGSVFFLFPIIWMVSTSLKTIEEVSQAQLSLIPAQPQWQNYTALLQDSNFTLAYENSIFIIFIVLVGTIASISLVAYSFSRLEWRGRNVVFALMMSTLMLPPQATLVPQYVLFNALGWVPGFNPVVIPGFFAGGAALIFLLRQFMLGLPRELDEAAQIDGANPLQIWWYIILPLSRPAIATVTVFLFVAQWNNLFMPLIYLKSASLTTMPIYVALKFNQQESPIPWNDIMAASVLFVLPVMIIFVLTQRYFTEGIALTGRKG
ncbi:MAG: carbohydrate ABC transporter permease [Chloroflexota bacterium]